MKKFILKLLISSIVPIFLLIYIMFTGFNHNLHMTKLKIYPVLIGEPYSEEYFKWYKWQKNLDNIEIITVGSSRVLQFKDYFFSESFFNLGKIANTPKEILKLITIKGIKNKTLLISLDQWHFNKEYNSSNWSFTEPFEPNFFKTSINNNRVYDILTLKIYPIIHNDNHIIKIGASAFFGVNGMKGDGSFYYGNSIHGLLTKNNELIGEDYNFSNTIDRIKKGDMNFKFGTICDQKTIKDFEDLVIYNKQNGNRAIYFFPPFAPTIQNLLKSENYKYIAQSSEKINQIAKENNVLFIDYTFMKSTDAMYHDGFHGGAKLYYEIAKSFGINIKDCQFKNNFETNNDSLLSKERVRFFNSSKSNQTRQGSN